MAKAEKTADQESIVKINEYKKVEKHMFRDLAKLRAELETEGKVVDYTKYQNRLTELIAELKGALLDIEMAMEQSLDKAMAGFINNVKGINEQISEAQLVLAAEVSSAFQDYAVKLKEELNKEREQFATNMDINPDAALDDYNVARDSDGNPQFDLGSTCELLVDDNKDAVDEMVTQF